jgi:CheY-like chemotaxis protein
VDSLEPVRPDITATLRPHALIVDDDPAGQLTLRKLLADCGYDTELAQNGAEGVARFTAKRPDVVFMDMSMPVMDGIDATRRIKNLCGDEFVPVIFITGTTDDDDLVRCIDAGGNDVLRKPYNAKVLAALIRRMERIRMLHQHTAALNARMEDEHHRAKGIHDGTVMVPNVRPTALNSQQAPAATSNGEVLLSGFSQSGDLHVLLGDFTAHGLAATIGALPAAETFRAMTEKGFRSAVILAEFNRKRRTRLPTGKFLSAVFDYQANGNRACAKYAWPTGRGDRK